MRLCSTLYHFIEMPRYYRIDSSCVPLLHKTSELGASLLDLLDIPIQSSSHFENLKGYDFIGEIIAVVPDVKVCNIVAVHGILILSRFPRQRRAQFSTWSMHVYYCRTALAFQLIITAAQVLACFRRRLYYSCSTVMFRCRLSEIIDCAVVEFAAIRIG